MKLFLVAAVLATLACAQPRRGFGGPSGLSDSPTSRNPAEQKVIDTIRQAEQYLNVPTEDGRLLRLFAESSNAKVAVEIGASTGISGMWIGLALTTTGGHLTTFEYDPERAKTARANYAKAGLDKVITLIEGDAHEKIKTLKPGIDFVFIDADKEGYRDYLDTILPLVKPGGLILAHNITNRSSNPNYVEAVTSNPNLETILFNNQMAVTLKKR